MKSTTQGKLNDLRRCTIDIPGADTIILNNLPDISDTKQAVYNTENIMGRSFPLYTYSHSADRVISMQLHFFVVNPGDEDINLGYLRSIQSAVYPREDVTAPYKPPPICKICCGDLLSSECTTVCVILQSYSVKFPTDVPWHEKNYCPYRFDVDTTWWVVYDSANLPYQSRIVHWGY